MSPSSIQNVKLDSILSSRSLAHRPGAAGSVPLSATGYTRSPDQWGDQVLYFLLVDRFSDGREDGYRDIKGGLVKNPGGTAVFRPSDARSILGSTVVADAWRETGTKYAGGKLKGIESKIGYLKRMGVTALWLSPIFKQVKYEQTYHGYGIQDFLEVNPEFGSLQDLQSLVDTAHENGIHVILDIILNHTGDVFAYEETPGRYTKKNDQGVTEPDQRWDGNTYPVLGFKDASGHPTLAFQPCPGGATSDCAIWPSELQTPATFTQKGHINNWDYKPEYTEGDFCTLKDINLGCGENECFTPSPTLARLCEVYKYWIAATDIDGFRIDTVKHMPEGAVRIFASAMHEFAQKLGKERFYLIGEITGGRTNAFDILERTGLDAALGVDDIPDKLHYMVKGYRNPEAYFSLFRNSEAIGKESHTWFNDKIVTVIDDHDQIWKGKNKARFCFNEACDQNNRDMLVNVLGLNALSMGIPCIYYGTEQYFEGHGGGDGSDRYIREAMFGGGFGPFESTGRHCFDENCQAYKELGEILKVRQDHIALRRGRQYLRPISDAHDGVNFGTPVMMGNEIRSIVPWSRIFDNEEVVVVINTDHSNQRSAWVTGDSGLHAAGDTFTCVYSTDKSQTGRTATLEARNGLSMLMTLPAAGMAVYAKK